MPNGLRWSSRLGVASPRAGLRGVLVQAPETGGFELAVKTDAMGVRTSTAKARGLEAQQAEVTRLRLGLEGWRPFHFEDGASLTPSFEMGVRHDGGDAEAGFGAEVGGGLAWLDPQRGLSAEFRGRGLLSHAAAGFREQGFSGSLSWDPTPKTGRGLKLSLSQTVGAQATGGVDALLGRNTLAGLAANDDGGSGNTLAQRRFETRLGYGLAALGDRFTSTPEIGFGMSSDHREYSLGWRLVRDMRGDAGSLEFALEAARRETVNDDGAEPEHTAGFRATARW